MNYRIDKWIYDRAKSLGFALFSLYISFVQPLKSPKELLTIKLNKIKFKRIQKISKDKFKATSFKKEIVNNLLKLYENGHVVLSYSVDKNKLYIDDAFCILHLNFGLPLKFDSTNNNYAVESSDFIPWFNNLSNDQILDLDLI